MTFVTICGQLQRLLLLLLLLGHHQRAKIIDVCCARHARPAMAEIAEKRRYAESW
jgi:hypothetical protein